MKKFSLKEAKDVERALQGVCEFYDYDPELIRNDPCWGRYSERALSIIYWRLNRVEELEDHTQKLLDDAKYLIDLALEGVERENDVDYDPIEIWILGRKRSAYLEKADRLLRLSGILRKKSDEIYIELLESFKYLRLFLPERDLKHNPIMRELDIESQILDVMEAMEQESEYLYLEDWLGELEN